MEPYLPSLLSALWLGILTSISPCPLATNVAAISFIGKQLDKPRYVLLSGVLYMFGRVFAYTSLGVLLVAGATSIFDTANFLQGYFNIILGPILIFVGIILMGWINTGTFGITGNEKIQKKAQSLGLWGAGFLGIIFAMSFCPVSAALFFGSLIPLAAKSDSSLGMPSVYGIGTGLPVIIFAFILAFGARWVGDIFNRLKAFEIWARRITALIFIGVGIYYALIYIFKIHI
ncbi:MAG: sulfite exporter TauE/SafE family protein [candidate division Zixibacteria bacterium]|nr:sulfite exporter TauE/SafE family protein [candidate division Zixibacteria bacterium]